MSTNIVVVGASFGGRAFIDEVAPKLPSEWKILAIEPNSQALYHIGLPRGVVKPDFAQKLYLPLDKFFAKHSRNVTHIKSKVSSVDREAKTVTLQDGQVLSYGYLVIASGSSAALPWKYNMNEDAPLDKLKAFIQQCSEAFSKAQVVVIGGAGPIGIETAAEVKDRYPKTRVVLINANKKLLQTGGWPKSVAEKLESQLLAHGVEIINGTKVMSPGASTSLTPTSVQLSNGTNIDNAVYISAIGFSPNSSFIPGDILDNHGYVKTDASLRSIVDENIYAVGDVTANTRKFSHVSDNQGGIAAANVLNAINKSGPSKSYDDNGTFMGVVQLAQYGGSGAYGWLTMPAFVVKRLKGKDLFVSMAQKRF